jgi:hypothetical protein
MKNKLIEKYFQQIDSIKSVSPKVQIVLLKNKFKMKDQFELIQELKKSFFGEDYVFYITSLKHIYSEYCEETSPNIYKPKDKEEFEKALSKFNEENKDLIISSKEKEFVFGEFLEEDVDFVFSKYTLEDLPEDLEGFSEDQIELLFKFINN